MTLVTSEPIVNKKSLLLKLASRLQNEYWFNDTPTFAVMSWLRHGGACVYCERSLMTTVEALQLSNCDHLLPGCKYPTLDTDTFNRVPACRYCNQLKGSWDPNYEPRVWDSSISSLSVGPQRELINRTKEYLHRRADEANQRFTAMLPKWEAALAEAFAVDTP